MKVTCLQENLAQGLGIVGRAVNAATTLPILGHVRLQAAGGQLELTGTNLEMTTATAPVSWKAVGEDGFLHVLMPMHVAGAPAPAADREPV